MTPILDCGRYSEEEVDALLHDNSVIKALSAAGTLGTLEHLAEVTSGEVIADGEAGGGEFRMDIPQVTINLMDQVAHGAGKKSLAA